MLNQKEFRNYVEEHILEYMTSAKDKTVSVEMIKKNNGVSYFALCIDSKEQQCTPLLYLEQFYQEYEAGKDLGELMCRIAMIYEECREKVPDGMDQVLSYENVKDQIFFKVVHYEKNKEMLKHAPYERMEDLVLVYRICMDVGDGGLSSALIHNSELKHWGISKEELKLHARENTEKMFPAEIKPMHEILAKYVKADVDNTLYVLTNNIRINGASAMFYKDILYNFAKKEGSNLYILPSSIHEVLLLKEKDAPSIAELYDTVKCANQSVVDPEEVLSDCVYYYDREEDTISVVR